jgi:hypothetical protein
LGDYINPYLELSAGVQVLTFYMLNNQLDDDAIFFTVPSFMLSEKLEMDTYYGLISLEGGIDILPESLVVFQDTSLEIEVFGGCNVILGGSTEDISVYRFVNKYWETGDEKYLEDLGWKARFIPYYGFGLKFAFDL